MEHPIAWGVGIVIGATAMIIIIKYYSEWKKAQQTNDKEALSKYNIQKDTVDTLTYDEISVWYKNNRDKYGDDAQMIVALPKCMEKFNTNIDNSETGDLENHIFQLFYNPKTKEVYAMRDIEYLDIEPNLHAFIIENDGIVIISE